MHASTWIELGTLLFTAIGGGTVGVSKLTRIAVAAETLAEKIEAITRTVAAVSAVVQEHETRISRIEGGGPGRLHLLAGHPAQVLPAAVAAVEVLAADHLPAFLAYCLDGVVEGVEQVGRQAGVGA